MTLDLTTTNVFLGIIATVSVLEALAILGLCIGGLIVCRRVLEVVGGLEERQVAPAVARVNAILDDVKDVTSTVKKETGQFEKLVDWIVERIARTGRRSSEASSGRMM